MPNVIRCHHCGCNDTQKKFEFGSSVTYSCNFCGRDTVGESEFRKYQRLEEVEYLSTPCPACGSLETNIVRGPQYNAKGEAVRHHQCSKCPAKFRSRQGKKKGSGRFAESVQGSGEDI